MRRGAAGYLVKPFADDEITSRLERLLGAATSPEENRGTYGFDRIIGRSPGMLDAVESARRVARSDATTVLITGESGSGKERSSSASSRTSPSSASAAGAT
jgi:DNA-binding NtrC family response regulator